MIFDTNLFWHPASEPIKPVPNSILLCFSKTTPTYCYDSNIDSDGAYYYRYYDNGYFSLKTEVIREGLLADQKTMEKYDYWTIIQEPTSP